MPKIGGQDGDPVQLQPKDLEIRGQQDKFPGTATFRRALRTTGDQVLPTDILSGGTGGHDKKLITKYDIPLGPKDNDIINRIEEPRYPLTNERNHPDDLLIGDPVEQRIGMMVVPPAQTAQDRTIFSAGRGHTDRVGLSEGITGDRIPTNTDKRWIKKRIGDEIGLRLGDRGFGAGDLFPRAAAVGPVVAFPLRPKEPFTAQIIDVTDLALGLGDKDILTTRTYQDKILPERIIIQPRRLPGHGERPPRG